MKKLIFFVFTIVGQIAFATDLDSSSKDLLFVEKRPQISVLNSAEAEEIKIEYNPQIETTKPEVIEILKDHRIDAHAWIETLAALKVNMAKEIDESKITIPVGPKTENDFDNFAELSQSDALRFLEKKTSFLLRFSNVLKAFRLKPKFINRVLNEINNKFYQSSKLIAKSNSIGGTVMFSVSGGFALPQKIMQKLSEKSLFKFIPKSGGFYYLMGLGIGFSRMKNLEGKTDWVLDFYVDIEKLHKTLTGLIEVSAAGTYGVVYEHRTEEFVSQKSETIYGGLAGVFKQGAKQFGWAASTGLSFPPGIGSVLVYQDSTTRFYFMRISRSRRIEFPILADLWRKFNIQKASPVLACKEVFFDRKSKYSSF